MDAVGERRLLTLAWDLDTADEEHRAKKQPTYDQHMIKHSCGTPACAMGHWMRRARGRVVLTSHGALLHTESPGTDGVRHVGHTEFRITREEADELFGSEGCGKAKTAKQAAKYIRRFVKRIKKLESR